MSDKMTFDLEKARDLATNPIHCPETDEIFVDAIAEIERLRAELEDALVEDLARELAYDEGYRWPIWRKQDKYRKDARKQLRAEGKIGPDAKPRSWQITDARKAALSRAYDVISWIDRVDSDNQKHIDVLRDMLAEATR